MKTIIFYWICALVISVVVLFHQRSDPPPRLPEHQLLSTVVADHVDESEYQLDAEGWEADTNLLWQTHDFLLAADTNAGWFEDSAGVTKFKFFTPYDGTHVFTVHWPYDLTQGVGDARVDYGSMTVTGSNVWIETHLRPKVSEVDGAWKVEFVGGERNENGKMAE